MLERARRRRPSDDERHHHVREDDDVAERDDGEGFVEFHVWGCQLTSCQLSAVQRSSCQRIRCRERCGAGQLEADSYPAFSISVIGFSLRLHDFARDDALADLLLAGQRVHQVEHQVLDDHPEAARADLARSAASAIASSESSVKRSFTFSYSNSFWY